MTEREGLLSPSRLVLLAIAITIISFLVVVTFGGALDLTNLESGDGVGTAFAISAGLGLTTSMLSKHSPKAMRAATLTVLLVLVAMLVATAVLSRRVKY